MKALTIDQAETWFKGAKCGDEIPYHEGYLAIDRERKSREHPKQKAPAAQTLDKIADMFIKWFDVSKVHLVQVKVRKSRYIYRAIKR